MKEWYLEKYTPNITSGYENDAISEYAQSNFDDVLETMFSDTVILYNNSMTEFNEIQCVIQGNSADTQLKSMERIGLFPIGTVKAGMYIFFENRYWLITGYPSNNKSYEKAVMQLCQYELCWQNVNGEIIKRWCCATSAAKYDTGETGNSTIVLSSDSITLLLSDDDMCLDLDGKRVFIDKRKTNPTKVYKITRTDSILYDYGEHGGILSFIADKGELNSATDNQELRICDYVTVDNTTDDSDETDVLWSLKLKYTTLKIKPLDKEYTITAHLYDGDGNEITEDVGYVWDVQSIVKEYLTCNEDGNTLILSLSSDCEEFGETITVSCMSEFTGHSDTIELEVTEVW